MRHAEAPTLSRPLEQWHITSPFGPRESGPHPGIDLRAPLRTPVYAAADGIVESSRDGDELARASGKRSYGERIFLVHAGGWRTLYAHLAGREVEDGEQVERGQLIGFTGNTGTSGGPHLHFELRDPSGKPINPTPFFETMRT